MNLKKWKKKGKNSYPKLKRSPEERHTQTYLIYFDDHRWLSQSEESKCMWTHGKDTCIYKFTYIYSLPDWERNLWLSKYIILLSMCLCVPFLRRSLHFSVRVFPFFFHFCRIVQDQHLQNINKNILVIFQDVSRTKHTSFSTSADKSTSYQLSSGGSCLKSFPITEYMLYYCTYLIC